MTKLKLSPGIKLKPSYDTVLKTNEANMIEHERNLKYHDISKYERISAEHIDDLRTAIFEMSLQCQFETGGSSRMKELIFGIVLRQEVIDDAEILMMRRENGGVRYINKALVRANLKTVTNPSISNEEKI